MNWKYENKEKGFTLRTYGNRKWKAQLQFLYFILAYNCLSLVSNLGTPKSEATYMPDVPQPLPQLLFSLSFFKWANPSHFFIYFRSFQTQILQSNCILQQDSNSDRQNRRRTCRPFDHHHGHLLVYDFVVCNNKNRILNRNRKSKSQVRILPHKYIHLTQPNSASFLLHPPSSAPQVTMFLHKYSLCASRNCESKNRMGGGSCHE